MPIARRQGRFVRQPGSANLYVHRSGLWSTTLCPPCHSDRQTDKHTYSERTDRTEAAKGEDRGEAKGEDRGSQGRKTNRIILLAALVISKSKSRKTGGVPGRRSFSAEGCAFARIPSLSTHAKTVTHPSAWTKSVV
jgi:hypothetical protein